MTYYATYFGLLIAAYVGHGDAQVRKLLYWILLSGLFLFSGFRFEVGCDWIGYLRNYSIYFNSYAEAWTRSEPGHWTIIHFLHQAELPYIYLNVITSGIFFLGLHILAKRQPNPLTFLVLAFPILIINMPMSAIRQGAAIGFVCIAFSAFIDRRLIWFVACVLAGSLFHPSSLLFLILAPFIMGDFNKRNILIASLLALPGVYGLAQLDAAEVAQQRYIDTGIDAAGAVFRLGILTLSGLLFVWWFAPKWRAQFPKDYKLASIGAWMMVAFFGIFFISSTIGDRFGYYLIPIQIMIFSRIPYLNGLSDKQLFTALPYVGLTLVFVVWTQLSWHFNKCYIPYENVLFGAGLS